MKSVVLWPDGGAGVQSQFMENKVKRLLLQLIISLFLGKAQYLGSQNVDLVKFPASTWQYEEKRVA